MSQFWKTVFFESMDHIKELEDTIYKQSAMISKMQEQIDQHSNPSAESKTSVNDIVAGAIFDFMGMFTTRAQPLILSSCHDCTPAVDAVREFAERRGLDIDCPDVMSWSEKL